MNTRAVKLYPHASIAFVGFFLLTLAAFWPEYVVKLPNTPFDQNLHGAMMTIWFGMLITQPLLIRFGHRDVHRLLGRLSYAVFPIAVLSILMLAHRDLVLMKESRFWSHGQHAALPLTFAGMFVTSYVLAIRFRRQMPLHARFMIATSFPLIGPVVVRFFAHYVPLLPPFVAFLLSAVVLTDLPAAWLAWRDRKLAEPVRHAFRIVLAQQIVWQAIFFLLVLFPPHVFMQALHWYRGLPIP